MVDKNTSMLPKRSIEKKNKSFLEKSERIIWWNQIKALLLHSL